MLTVVDPTGRRAGSQAILGALAIIPITLLPAVTGWTLYYTAPIFFAAALVLGIGQLITAARFAWYRDDATARGLLRASLIYLPSILALLLAASLLFPRT